MLLCQQITFAELAQTAPVPAPAPIPVPVPVSMVSSFLFPVSTTHETTHAQHMSPSPQAICVNGSKLPGMGHQSPSIIV